MTIANVIKVNGDTINNKRVNINSLCLNTDKIISNFKDITINVKNKLKETYIPQNEYKIISTKIYHINSINGIDEIDSGDKNKPFRTLDYAINQLYGNNIFDNEIGDVYIYLDEGVYNLTNKKIFEGQENKHLYIIGQGIKTRLLNNFSGRNSTFGTANFNIHFYRLIWDNKNIATQTTNNLLFNNDVYFKNVLFTNINNDGYAWIGGASGAWFIENCIKDNFSTNFLRDDTSGKRSAIRNSYGYYTLGYGNPTHTIKENNKFIQESDIILLNDEYQITDPNIDSTKVGLYTGKYNWVQNSYNILLKDKVIKNVKENINKNTKIEKQQFDDNFIDIIKNNKNINVNHLSSTTVAEEIYVKESKKILKKNIIAKEIPIYVKDNTYKYRINPIIKAVSALIIVNGETQNDNEKVEGNIKGLNFIIQKGTFVEINLDFLKEDTIIESVSGLPEGLIFENNKIKGTPLKSGEYKLDMNISDDSTIECNLSVPPLIRLL